MTTEPTDYYIMRWQDALNRPGASQMQHLRRLIESRPFLERVPAQELLPDNPEGGNYRVATRGERYAMVYYPTASAGAFSWEFCRVTSLRQAGSTREPANSRA